LGNKKHNLLNKLKANLSNTFHDLKPTEFQKVNLNAVDTIAEGILGGYDRSFLRITDYRKTRILYYYSVENQMIVFSDDPDNPKYEIFSSALPDEETNVKSVNEVRSALIEALDKIIEQLLEELQSYNETNRVFTNERNTLLDRLLRVKYSTKLNFEKKNMRKKCSLA